MLRECSEKAKGDELPFYDSMIHMKKMKSVPTAKQSLFGHIKEMWKEKNGATKKADIVL